MRTPKPSFPTVIPKPSASSRRSILPPIGASGSKSCTRTMSATIFESISKCGIFPCSAAAGSPISACPTSMFRDCGSGSARCASSPCGFWSRRPGACAASGRCGGLRYLSTGYLLLKRNPTPSIR